MLRNNKPENCLIVPKDMAKRNQSRQQLNQDQLKSDLTGFFLSNSCYNGELGNLR